MNDIDYIYLVISILWTSWFVYNLSKGRIWNVPARFSMSRAAGIVSPRFYYKKDDSWLFWSLFAGNVAAIIFLFCESFGIINILHFGA
jgi:hypothetical protein